MQAGEARKLVAIVAADVVGFSRLVGNDEERTVGELRAVRAELIEPALKEHRGRIANTAGDGFLLAFDSAVDAVRFAVQLQQSVEERRAQQPSDRQIRLRIGVNVGDVIEENGDLLGDGVNIAARLESLAEAGEICLSDDAYRQVRDRLTLDVDDLGEISVKNIVRPVHVHRIAPTGHANASRSTSRFRRRWHWVGAAALALIIVVAVGWYGLRPDFKPADPNRFEHALPSVPSVAILPLRNLSGDKEQEHLAAGLSENIIAVLAASPDLFVVAGNSSFVFKGAGTDAATVAEKLGVRYVLSGGFQKSDGRLRVTAQLVDALNGRHLWSERYDRREQDWFAIQDDIARRILISVDATLSGTDLVRTSAGIRDLPTLLVLIKAYWLFNQFNPEANSEAQTLVARAMQDSPDNSRLHGMMGGLIWWRATVGLSQTFAEDLKTARMHAVRAIELDDRNEHGHYLLGSIEATIGRYDAAIRHADKAVALAPSAAYAIASAGWVHGISGQHEQAVALFKRAMRIDPFHQAWMKAALAYNQMALQQFEAARNTYRDLLAMPDIPPLQHTGALRGLAAMAVFEGDLETARRHAAALREDVGTGFLQALVRLDFVYRDAAFRRRLHDALIQAGLPAPAGR